MNPNWERIGITPTEITLRDTVGVSVDMDKLVNCRAIAEDLFARADEFEVKISQVLSEHIYNQGKAGKAGAEYLLSSLVEKRKKS